MRLNKMVLIIPVVAFLGLLNCKPDLQVTFESLSSYQTGQDVGPTIKVTVYNKGNDKALGTQDAGSDGYMVDLILSSDQVVPIEFAIVPSPYVFTEDMLLMGGRISNTETLNPGESETYKVSGVIPPGIQTMGYLCTVVDPGKKIDETNENNNTFFKQIKILSP